jgi:hypothetical protein
MKFSRSQDVVFKPLFLLNYLLTQKEHIMNYCSRWYRSVLAGMALIAGLGLFSTPALAQFVGQGLPTAGGISANTDITNTATLNYAIGGTSQPAVPSNQTTFKVDNLVRVQVTEVGGAVTNVAPNATAQVTTFTVTNTGNAIMDFALTPNGAIATGQTVVLTGTTYTDSNITPGFDATGCVARVESGATAGFQAAQDTAAAIMQLTPLTAGGGNTVTVYVVCNIPSAVTATNGNNALVSLTATTSNFNTCNAAGTTCVTTAQTAGADTPGVVDVVFGDAAGSDDAARDGKHSARDVYQVAAAVISVSKTVTPICDPFNAAVSPKNIPGAYVRYEITITNAVGAASATLTDISDALSSSLAFDSDQRTGATAPCSASPPANAAGAGFSLICTGTTRACQARQFFTTANDGDAMVFAANTVTVKFGTGGGAVTGTQALPAEGTYAAGELKGGESVTIRYNGIIQ